MTSSATRLVARSTTRCDGSAPWAEASPALAASAARAAPAGDLLVKVEVVVPKAMTEDQRAAVEALAVAFDEQPVEEPMEEEVAT